MERIEREANGQQRDRSKNHHQDRAYPSRFDVEKSDDFWLKMLCVDLRNCARHLSGEHIFIKSMKKDDRKVKKSSERPWMASVMHICAGLLGPKSGNVEKVLVFKAFLKGHEGHEGSRESSQLSEPGQFRRRKSDFPSQNASCRYAGLCFLLQRGVLFQQNDTKSSKI